MDTTDKPSLNSSKVTAAPTKKFFMRMLTRDIELRDAIFDLLDNCLDGVHRTESRKADKFSYEGYYCKLDINGSKFQLTDNCGGISLEIAKTYAFKMGRDENYHLDDNIQTVGMYGIGMKRAIFKIGNAAKVYSKNKKDNFCVNIPDNWSDNNLWEFDLENPVNLTGILEEDGTKIIIEKLEPQIAIQFDDEALFMQELRNGIQSHYGYLISRGFKIILNDIPVDKLEITILTARSAEAAAIKPYVFKQKFGTVDVEMFIGFYREPATGEELENELDGSKTKRATENAGITILCNDRVVLYRDKTQISGWGDHPVPAFHTQFINIAGVVHIKSDKPIDLPVTTTKRGIDTSHHLYYPIRSRIKDGLKIFTQFTNSWKKQTNERDNIFKDLDSINILAPGQSRSDLVKLTSKRTAPDAFFQTPELPKPHKTEKNPSRIKIQFYKEKDDIELVAKSNEIQNKNPNHIGEWCFDEILRLVKLL